MKRCLFFLISLVSGFALLLAQTHSHKPYQHNAKRTIKALSPQEVQGYLSGEGMGMALPAELNHFPGPRHVLDLSDSLNLTPQQHQLIKMIFDQMHEKAARLGKQIVDNEKQLESLFSGALPDSQQIHRLVIRNGRLKAELRWTHLRAHILTRQLLTEEQIRRYDYLRGYASD